MPRYSWLIGAAFVQLVACPVTAQGFAGGGQTSERIQHRTPKAPGTFKEAEGLFAQMWAERPAVTRIRVPGRFFLQQPLQTGIPVVEGNRHVSLDLRGDAPTLGDLATILEAQGVPVTIDWRSLGSAGKGSDKAGAWTIESRYQNVANDVTTAPSSGYGGSGGQGGLQQGQQGSASSSGGQSTTAPVVGSKAETVAEGAAGREGVPDKPIAERLAPFRAFNGSVSDLARRLEATGNLAVWWDGGIVIGSVRRYTVSIFQNVDIVQSVVNELRSLGATDVVGSVGSGSLIYSASPRVATEIIQPYLRRVQQNLSEVRLQVALVVVRMDRQSEQGFDWAKFNLQFGQAGGPATGGTTGTLSGDSTGFRATGRTPTTLFGINKNDFEIASKGVNIFGVTQPLSIAGAIAYLSQFGETEVTQTAELASISGAPVVLRSGQSIPFSTGVQTTNVGGGGGIASSTAGSQTAFLQTGLTINFDPRYDAATNIVSLDIGLKLVELDGFIDVKNGNQIGALSQPSTSQQNTNSFLRIPAGTTSVVGGLRRDSAKNNRSGPFGMYFLGKRSRGREVFSLFTVVRPVVTIFETDDNNGSTNGPPTTVTQSTPERAAQQTEQRAERSTSPDLAPTGLAGAQSAAVTVTPIPFSAPVQQPPPPPTPVFAVRAMTPAEADAATRDGH